MRVRFVVPVVTEATRKVKSKGTAVAFSSLATIDLFANSPLCGSFCTRPLLGHRHLSSVATTTPQERRKEKQELEAERLILQSEASSLTRSLYRCIVRSVRHIRHGNAHDETEFQAREAKRESNMSTASRDTRLSMLSLLPPVDRVDELRSRAEYYQQFARENFIQESDCFHRTDWEEHHVARYLFLLRRGEEQRQWLLADMKFHDPYSKRKDDSSEDERVRKWEARALAYVLTARQNRMKGKLSPKDYHLYLERTNTTTTGSATQTSLRDDEAPMDEEGWSSEDDDDGKDSTQ